MTGITNEQRAAWAAHALLSYATGKEGGEELYDATDLVLSDLLCDLKHLADREGLDFEVCSERAAMHYDEEKSEGDPAQRYIAALSDAVSALRRIAEVTHYENGETVTALESREIESIYADATGQLEDFETILKAARGQK